LKVFSIFVCYCIHTLSSSTSSIPLSSEAYFSSQNVPKPFDSQAMHSLRPLAMCHSKWERGVTAPSWLEGLNPPGKGKKGRGMKGRREDVHHNF